MKLLSSKEVKEQSTLTDKVRESRFLDNLLGKKRQNLEEVKAKVDPEIIRLEQEFLVFSQGINQKRSSLLREIAVLEEQREKALEPLDLKWYELSVKEQELDEKEKTLDKIEDDRAKEKELLLNRMEMVEEKEHRLAEKELRLKELEKGIDNQAKLSAQSLIELNKQWLNLRTEQIKHTKEVKEKSSWLAEQEQAIAVNKQSLEAKEKELLEFKKKLNDERGVLDRAWQELKNGRQSNI